MAKRAMAMMVLAGPLLAGCAGGDWYANHCRDKGLQAGSADYARCLEETRAWVEETQRRLGESGKNL